MNTGRDYDELVEAALEHGDGDALSELESLAYSYGYMDGQADAAKGVWL